MIKLTASLSKKVPIAGMNYSSQNFMAGLEVELSDAAALPEVQTRIREVYGLLEASINEQIRQHQPQNPTDGQERSPRQAPRDNRGGRYARREDNRENRQTFPASQAQLKAIAAISRERGMEEAELSDVVERTFHCRAVEELTLREASKLIGMLKGENARQAG